MPARKEIRDRRGVGGGGLAGWGNRLAGVGWLGGSCSDIGEKSLDKDPRGVHREMCIRGCI